MRHAKVAIIALLTVTPLLCHDAARAAWPNDPGVNVKFAPGPGYQWLILATEDGAGGAFIVWSEANDIFAQHLTAAGLVEPGWPPGGIVVCNEFGAQFPSDISSDGAGGFMVVWDDYRSGALDIYAQRIAGNGSALWAANGVAACAAAGEQHSARVSSDRAGGAIVAWRDERDFGTTGTDLYAQRLSAAGAPLWAANGVALCALPLEQDAIEVLSDGTVGGAYFAWRDGRGADVDIYASRLNAVGGLVPGWLANGTQVSAAPGDEEPPALALDGAFGLYVSWAGQSAGLYEINLARWTPLGSVAAGWPAGGMAVTSDPSYQNGPVMVPDGAGGVVLAWTDYRNASVDVYAQRVGSVGTPAWAAGGVPLTLASDFQIAPRIASDGAGGAVVAWQDLRAGGNGYMVYAQRITGAGTIAAGFAPDGNAIATAHWAQSLVLCSDGAGGAIMAWQNNAEAPAQGYAQRIDRWGYLGAQPRIAAVSDVPNDQGGRVKMSWDPSPLDAFPDFGVTSYMIYRSVPPQAALAALERGEAVLERDEAAAGSHERAAVASGRTLLATQLAGVTYYWEHLADVAATQLPGYSYVAATAQDSVDGSNPMTLFMVRAQDSNLGRYWFSDPDSGYSTDDLAPAAPAPFTGVYSSGATYLHWGANTEADFAHYRLYRGETADFVPAPENLVAAPPDTGHVDSGPAGSFYKLTAVDSHGNESPVSLLSPSGTVAVDGEVRWTLALLPPSPNPFSAAALCRFTLPDAGPVRVAVYDAAGRLVRVLADGHMSAGDHSLRWAGERGDGGIVPNGLYVARLTFAGRTLTQKLLRVR
jgi:hypothetical protein